MDVLFENCCFSLLSKRPHTGVFHVTDFQSTTGEQAGCPANHCRGGRQAPAHRHPSTIRIANGQSEYTREVRILEKHGKSHLLTPVCAHKATILSRTNMQTLEMHPRSITPPPDSNRWEGPRRAPCFDGLHKRAGVHRPQAYSRNPNPSRGYPKRNGRGRESIEAEQNRHLSSNSPSDFKFRRDIRV